MHLLCVGISHQTAPVALRERLAFNDEAALVALRELATAYADCEIALLSTCNRTEFYLARPLHGHPRVDELVAFLARSRGVPMEQLAGAVYHHDNDDVVRHLMRVASGLESMVLGEHQVLGQVRHTYELAQQAGSVSKVLHRLFQSALATGKQVRTETRIGAGRTSVSSVAVDFARRLFSRFDDKTLLTIGAGKMTELTLEHFAAHSPQRIVVCNRSIDKARALAGRFNGEAASIDLLDEHLVAADVVISCTGSSEAIITASEFKPLLRRRRFRPLFIIDIAVPRDFEDAVGNLSNVYLYNLDDLQQAIAEQMAQRTGEVAACQAIIEQAAVECYAAVQTTDFNDLIRQLRAHLHELGDAENRRTLSKLRSADPADLDRLITEHTHRLLNKILHRPVSEIGRSGPVQAAMYATALRRIFELDGPSEDLDQPEPNRLPPREAATPGPGTAAPAAPSITASAPVPSPAASAAGPPAPADLRRPG
jgi:glutamyl-tRNA reductase